MATSSPVCPDKLQVFGAAISPSPLCVVRPCPVHPQEKGVQFFDQLTLGILLEGSNRKISVALRWKTGKIGKINGLVEVFNPSLGSAKIKFFSGQEVVIPRGSYKVVSNLTIEDLTHPPKVTKVESWKRKKEKVFLSKSKVEVDLWKFTSLKAIQSDSPNGEPYFEGTYEEEEGATLLSQKLYFSASAIKESGIKILFKNGIEKNFVLFFMEDPKEIRQITLFLGEKAYILENTFGLTDSE